MGIVIAVTLVLLLIVVVVVVGVKLFDLSGKREAKAERLEEKVSRALRRDHRLSRLWIVPVAHVPSSTHTPLTVEVVGQVPTAEARETALRVVGRETSHTRSHFRIEDRIEVEPARRDGNDPEPARRGGNEPEGDGGRRAEDMRESGLSAGSGSSQEGGDEQGGLSHEAVTATTRPDRAA